MLLKLFFFLFAVGQAAQFQAIRLQAEDLKATHLNVALPSESSSNAVSVSDCPFGPECTRINATFTSFNVLGGNGCPAGTYHSQPLGPGALETSVDFDDFYFNHTFPAEVQCTVTLDFEFTYPESGMPDVTIASFSAFETKYGDENEQTDFSSTTAWNIQAGNFAWEGGLGWNHYGDANGTNGGLPPVFPVGTAGEVDVGTMQITYKIWTSNGPGEIKLPRVVLRGVSEGEFPLA